MQYQGGKAKIADRIADILIQASVEHNCDTLVSLFCGACSVESASAKGFKHTLLNDKNNYLISLLKAVQQGWEPPSIVTKEQYDYVRMHKDEDPALTGFIGFGCSFGGKFFGGYAKNKRNTNFADTAKRTLLRDLKPLDKTIFTCLDYRDLELPPKAVIYADPPYANTLGYLKEGFDTVTFWNYMRKLSQLGYLVFISEENAPADFVPVLELSKIRTINIPNNKNIVLEKLYTLRS